MNPTPLSFGFFFFGFCLFVFLSFPRHVFQLWVACQLHCLFVSLSFCIFVFLSFVFFLFVFLGQQVRHGQCRCVGWFWEQRPLGESTSVLPIPMQIRGQRGGVSMLNFNQVKYLFVWLFGLAPSNLGLQELNKQLRQGSINYPWALMV